MFDLKILEKINHYAKKSHQILILTSILNFIAPHSPQNNGKVERKIATLLSKTRAMLNHAQLT
jgi:hypothetical protein